MTGPHMPNCLIFYHYQIVNLHQYLQTILIIYFTENFAVYPLLIISLHCIEVSSNHHAFSILMNSFFFVFLFCSGFCDQIKF